MFNFDIDDESQPPQVNFSDILHSFLSSYNQRNRPQQNQNNYYGRMNQGQPQQPSPYEKFGSGSNYSGSQNNDLLSRAKEAIMRAYPDNPVMQKVALTQAILESGLMRKPSKLATENNNLFGIKAGRSAPGSGSVNYGTNEYGPQGNYRENANFSRNNSFEDSAMQYAKLMNNKRYGNVLNAQDPIQAFQALQKAGYATDPNYAKKLSSIYQRNVNSLF